MPPSPINHGWTDDQGERHEKATFVGVNAFGRTAEVITEHCKKGSRVLVEGRLNLNEWEDKQTKQKRSLLDVVCESFHFAGGKAAK